MEDRNVQYPQRYQFVKVEGTDDIYDVIPAPGEVYEDGTLINKATLLKDATAALFGLDSTAVPDDVFFAIGLPSDQYAVKVTVLDPNGNPLPGITLTGITTRSGNQPTTDLNGEAIGFSSNKSPTITAVAKYYDYAGDVSASPTLEAGVLNAVSIYFARKESQQGTIASSQIIYFSPDVNDFDCSCIGGGDSGYSGSSTTSALIGGRGGNAGEISNAQGVKNTGQEIIVTVGGVGGTSSINTYVTGKGGAGSQGGSGEYYVINSAEITTEAQNGRASSGFLYPPTAVGGSGAGGSRYNAMQGGSPGGGDGGTQFQAGQNGSYPGSGGGGGARGDCNVSYLGGGLGKAGLCGFVWRYADGT